MLLAVINGCLLKRGIGESWNSWYFLFFEKSYWFPTGLLTAKRGLEIFSQIWSSKSNEISSRWTERSINREMVQIRRTCVRTASGLGAPSLLGFSRIISFFLFRTFLLFFIQLCQENIRNLWMAVLVGNSTKSGAGVWRLCNAVCISPLLPTQLPILNL